MLQPDQPSNRPLFSIIIPVYDDWAMLDGCLESLARETEPGFEVIVVDDGSHQPAPEYIRRWSSSYPLTIHREDHKGISSARNRGIGASRGTVLVFIDADSRIQLGCLTTLASTVAKSPQHNFFQLCLVGDRSRLMGRAEELRLMIFQRYMLKPDGCIRYLNTAGFAVRRAELDIAAGLFDPAAVRAEDTLLLANLILRSELPLFVPEATVQHEIALSLIECLRKDVRSAYLEEKTYEIIASKGVRIRISNRERFSLLWSMWRASRQNSIGRSAWFVLVARESLERVISLVYGLFRVRS